ncbi:MAG TPA: methyltransferase domain-containing protein [Pseudomonas xinjiangensis]|uniref:Methyltransferase domain-containing protein n=2 Tax=root TaxID=1 RepID=A0A7V1BR48_9GAMM|nr:methyltransferase domain-containing protein [Halopseudomonas xinjiangensis]HEC47923.1 methyltransferase domain-containing protein [Halopseudomonas xinjiangensis]
MNLYEKHVLPRLIDAACGMGDVMKARAKVVPQACGEVLEIGIGTGLNLQFYDPGQVASIVGVDPAGQMQKLARKRAAAISIPVEMISVDLQGINAETARFDTIVMTFTLCSIADPVSALREMRRVLKPSGRLLFCEHGLAPEPRVQRWQRRLTPVWKSIAGGCHLDRDVPAMLHAGGFVLGELATEYLAGPKPMTYIFSGWAVATA